ncbi:hypothetical protein K8R33_02860 [archaeon]|nr:hypothetical protein [archaeon]
MTEEIDAMFKRVEKGIETCKVLIEQLDDDLEETRKKVEKKTKNMTTTEIIEHRTLGRMQK